MARKTMQVNISLEADNRDSGKRFIITEMPATKAEKWAARAINALLASGITIPDEVAADGLRGLARMGLAGLSTFSGFNWDQLEPLLDEMMTTVEIQPDINKDAVRKLIESDIEEISTRLKIRGAWLELHTGFSFAAIRSTSASEAAEKGLSNT